eukprot:15211488-Ditylum_brightwellii.AAC.1
MSRLVTVLETDTLTRPPRVGPNPIRALHQGLGQITTMVPLDDKFEDTSERSTLAKRGNKHHLGVCTNKMENKKHSHSPVRVKCQR